MKVLLKNHFVKSFIRLYFPLFLLVLGSCVTIKKTTYLQDHESSVIAAPDTVDNTYKVQIYDNLFVRVVTPDPRWAAMFNTLPVTSGTMSVGVHSLDLISYTVREDGNVVIPYLGPLEVVGKTLPEIHKIIEEALIDYISDAAITVKLVNNYVSILGDVNIPGRYVIFKENLNIFQALAMAGDLGPYSDRYNVQIIRETPEGTIVKQLDLTDRNIIDSEYYIVMPNDVIYSRPMKGKFFQMNEFPFVLILSTLSTFILLLNVIRN